MLLKIVCFLLCSLLICFVFSFIYIGEKHLWVDTRCFLAVSNTSIANQNATQIVPPLCVFCSHQLKGKQLFISFWNQVWPSIPLTRYTYFLATSIFCFYFWHSVSIAQAVPFFTLFFDTWLEYQLESLFLTSHCNLFLRFRRFQQSSSLILSFLFEASYKGALE